MQISYKPIQNHLSRFQQQKQKRKIGLIIFLTLSALILYLIIDLSSIFVIFGGSDENTDDLYSITPFCDPITGVCGETPDDPSPRTIYSAKSKSQYELWWKYHAYLNKTAQEYALSKTESQSQQSRIPLIFLGDSITESWLGTDMGREVDRAQKLPEIYQELFVESNNFDPIVFAIGGDQTQHLLYRIQNGQLLKQYSDNIQSIYVVLIGTNNIGSGELPDPAIKGVLSVAKYLLDNTKGHLILLKVLPRGDDFRTNRICPPRCRSNGQPFESFMPAINKLNHGIQDGIFQKRSDDFNTDRVSLIDCGSKFVKKMGNDDGDTTTRTFIDESLMPDYLHPNADGHRILGNCIMDTIQKIINV